MYFSPLIGGTVADSYLGKYKTIFSFSIVYVIGSLILTLTSIQALEWGMYLGLLLIALGSGGIKPCVASFGAEQYTAGDYSSADLDKYFLIFYAAINSGSIFSYIVAPFTRAKVGFPAAFSLSAVMLSLALLVFALPRKQYVHQPPAGSVLLQVLGAVCSACSLNGGCLPTCGLIMRSWGESCRCLQRPEHELGEALAAQAQGDPALHTATASPAGRVDAAAEALVPHADDAEAGVGSAGGGTALDTFEMGPQTPQLPLRGAEEGAVDGPAPVHKRRGAHWIDVARATHPRDVVDGAKAVLGVTPFFLAFPLFWTLFDQQGSAWTLQAKSTNLYFLEPDNIAVLGPALVLIFIPLYDQVIFPGLARCGIRPTNMQKIGAGMFLAAGSFVLSALVQAMIDGAEAAGEPKIPVMWMLPQYIVITAAEILVSTIGQAWMFSQAPETMRATMLAFWFASVGIGDVLAGVLYSALEHLPQQAFFWLFACLMGLAAVLYLILAASYTPSESALRRARAEAAAQAAATTAPQAAQSGLAASDALDAPLTYQSPELGPSHQAVDAFTTQQDAEHSGSEHDSGSEDGAPDVHLHGARV